jgi:hypothetical protein
MHTDADEMYFDQRGGLTRGSGRAVECGDHEPQHFRMGPLLSATLTTNSDAWWPVCRLYRLAISRAPAKQSRAWAQTVYPFEQPNGRRFRDTAKRRPIRVWVCVWAKYVVFY